MCDEWMPYIQLPLTIEQFHQLPRNPAYKYEYLNQSVYLSPRPKHYHAVLDLRPIEADGSVAVHPLQTSELMGVGPAVRGSVSVRSALRLPG